MGRHDRVISTPSSRCRPAPRRGWPGSPSWPRPRSPTRRRARSLRGFAEEQAALRRVATLVARAAPPEEVFAAVTAEAGRLLAADATLMSRYDPDDAVTVVGAWTSTGDCQLPVGSRLSLGGRNLHTLVFQTGRAARIDDYAGASGPAGEASPTSSGVRASVGVPVSVEGRLWGVMIVASVAEPLPAGHRGAAGRVHRAGRHRDRQRRGPGRADRLAGADRRHRRPDAPPDRARPARRRPAAAGLPRAAAAGGAGGGAARSR